MATYRLGQDAQARLLVSLGREQEIDRLAALIHAAIKVGPLACDLDGGVLVANALCSDGHGMR
jgi:hypothetical protein